MAIQKPSIPKGTRDFPPVEMVRRNYILDTIRTVYQRYGYQQIETPSFENTETLLGKYGDEGDKLIFKILDNGNFLEEIVAYLPNEENRKKAFPDGRLYIEDLITADTLSMLVASRALRYDLTVPFARYVVMHQNEITFPFKRYQIQPVWRADRPQKGRYREFYQCDADVIGSDSLLNEVEMIQMIDEVFSKLEIEVKIKINNRKILQGIAETLKMQDKFVDFTTLIDKLDKIGNEKMNVEFLKLGMSEEDAQHWSKLLYSVNSHNLWEERNDHLKKFLNESEVGLKGLNELECIFKTFDSISKSPMSTLEFDLTLARGLNYYTGAIIELKNNDSRSTFTGSLLGGGRYDDLTGIFGLPDVSGVGISFGVDRIYDVMEEMKLFEKLNLQSSTTQVMFVNFGKEEEKYCLKLLQQVRAAGINAELYPEAAKMKKQMGYADDKKIPFVVLVGSEEMKSGLLTLKNMHSGEQEKNNIDYLILKIKNSH